MQKAVTLLLLPMVATVLLGCGTKHAYIPQSPPPAFFDGYAIRLHSIGMPPLYRPPGKREPIRINSQRFTIVIPDVIDVSARNEDLRRPLADMMYTALFDTGRFNLLDRGELANIDPNRLLEELRQSTMPTGQEETRPTGTASGRTPEVRASDLIADRQRVQEIILAGIAQRADGLLMLYITTRQGTDAGGSFEIDYRIISTEPRSQALLLARTETVRYEVSTGRELVIMREDIQKIAEQITRTFPRQEDIPERSRVLALDAGFLTIDLGREQALKPGLRGYVYTEEDLAELPGAQQKIFLAQFQITEVYDHYSRAMILSSVNREDQSFTPTDIRVGDRVLIQ